MQDEWRQNAAWTTPESLNLVGHHGLLDDVKDQGPLSLFERDRSPREWYELHRRIARKACMTDDASPLEHLNVPRQRAAKATCRKESAVWQVTLHP